MSVDRLKRDFKLNEQDIKAIRRLLQKANLYDDDTRTKLEPLFKSPDVVSDEEEGKDIQQLIVNQEIELLKQKLMMSRKELDSYISFTKKMEREKRNIVSECEKLETKLEWHEKRLQRFESENKSLKSERASLQNTIYELKADKSNETAGRRHGSMDALDALAPEVEQTKQRLIYEADAFALERTKLIKERERLDEEVRKVQLKCVSLQAQLNHSEQTIAEEQKEKRDLKNKAAQLSRQVNEENRALQKKLVHTETALGDGFNIRDTQRQEYSAVLIKLQGAEQENERLKNELASMEQRVEQLTSEVRSSTDLNIKLQHETMALQDTVNVVSNAREEAENRCIDVDMKYRDALNEMKSLTDLNEKAEKDRSRVTHDLHQASMQLAENQRSYFELEADQDAFRKFLDKLSLQLQQQLTEGTQEGDEKLAKLKKNDTPLQERADLIGKEVLVYLSRLSSTELQSQYDEIKEERDDLEEEIKYLKFALSSRMEIKNMQAVKCNCNEKIGKLEMQLANAQKQQEKMEDDVARLHEDKQQLLISFLNLQAAQRSKSHRLEYDTGDETLEETTDYDDEDDYETGSQYSRTEGEESDYAPSESGSSWRSSKSSASRSRQHAGPLRTSETSGRESPQSRENLLRKIDELNNTNRKLEEDKINLMSTLCKQADKNASHENLDDSGNKEGCAKCSSASLEARHYLSIIEELTEDKLQLEKQVEDAYNNQDKFQNDRSGDERRPDRSSDNEILSRTAEHLEEEKKVLEESLRKLREDHEEILENLRTAEDDRFSFMRTMSLITEQKDAVDEQLKQANMENEQLQERLKAAGVF